MIVIDWYLAFIVRMMGSGMDDAFSRRMDIRTAIGGFYGLLPIIIFLSFSEFDVSKHPVRYAVSFFVLLTLVIGMPLLLFLCRRHINKIVKKSKPISIWRGLVYLALLLGSWWILDELRSLFA